MGLFGNMFEKKYCAVCGNEIKILGNRKLEDGNLCKDCAEKLSPWFDERRHSTVEQIKAQLAYREENRPKALAFNTTRSYGRCPSKLLIDEGAGTFMITSASDFAKANPDVLDLTQITSCILDTQEHKSELKQKNAEGKMVSYNPPRYEYSYDFYVKFTVNHPYIDDMRIRLNPSAVKTGRFSQKNPNAGVTAGTRPKTAADAALSGLASGVAGAFGVNNLNNRAGYSAEYEQYMALGNEIISFIDFRRNGYGQAAGAYGAVPGQYYTGQQPGQPYGAQPGYTNAAGQPYGNQQAYNGAAGQPYGMQPGYSNMAGQPYGAQPGYNNAAGQPYGAQPGYNNVAGQPYGAQPGYNGAAGQPYGAQPGYSNMAGQPYTNQPGYTGAAGQPYGTQPGYNGAAGQSYGTQQGYNNVAGQPYGTQPGYTGAAGQPYASQQVNNGTVGQTSASQQMNYGAPAQSCDAQPQPSGGVVRKVPCPFCGEMTTPSADGRCEFCLGKVF